MTTLTFSIEYRSPFAVATGNAEGGLDSTVDPRLPLPSTALKGLLKAQLVNGLGVSEKSDLVGRLFHAGDHLRWVFSDAKVEITPGAWVRVKVDDEGRADERFFGVGEVGYAKAAGSFRITWAGRGNPPADEVLALRAAARCVTSLGSHRRRGLGWVSITDNADWTPEDSERLLTLLSQGGA